MSGHATKWWEGVRDFYLWMLLRAEREHPPNMNVNEVIANRAEGNLEEEKACIGRYTQFTM